MHNKTLNILLYNNRSYNIFFNQCLLWPITLPPRAIIIIIILIITITTITAFIIIDLNSAQPTPPPSLTKNVFVINWCLLVYGEEYTLLYYILSSQGWLVVCIHLLPHFHFCTSVILVFPKQSLKRAKHLNIWSY